MILKEVCTNQELGEDLKTYEYVLDLRNRLEATCRLAREDIQEAGAHYAKHCNRKTKDWKFKPGDKDPILLPSENNKLRFHWKGLFEVQATIGDFHYTVKTPSGREIANY